MASTSATEEAWAAWVAKQGIECPAVSVTMHDFPPHLGGRGLRFTKDVSEGDVVLKVPRRAMLTGARARSLLPEGLLDSLAVAGLESAPTDDALAFALVIMLASMAMDATPSHLGEAGHALDPVPRDASAAAQPAPQAAAEAAPQAGAGAGASEGDGGAGAAAATSAGAVCVVAAAKAFESAGHPGAEAAAQLGPWVRVQPRPDDLGGLPVAWSEEELMGLGRHSTAYRQAQRLKAQWHSEWEALHGWLAASGAAVAVEEGDWWWARACARSRVFLDGLDEGGDDGGSDGWGGDQDAAAGLSVGLVMVPLADMMNHSPWDPLGEEELDDDEGEQGVWEVWAEGGFDVEAIPPACGTDWADDDEDDNGDCDGDGDGGGEDGGCKNSGGGWFVVRATADSLAGTQCCISYDCWDLSATLGTYGFTPVPAEQQPEVVGGSPGAAVATVLGPVFARLTEDVALPDLAELAHWCREASASSPDEAGLLAETKRAALQSLGVDVPSPSRGEGSPLPLATVALPALTGGLPTAALALLRVACASSLEEVDELSSAAIDGSADHCCAGVVTERHALEALARMCARCCGSGAMNGRVVCRLAQEAARPGLHARALDAARSSLARAAVAWSCTLVAQAGLAALNGDSDAVSSLLRDAALTAAPPAVRAELDDFVRARADMA